MGTTWTPEFADEGAFEQVAKPPSGKYVSSLIDAATLDGKVWGKPWYAGSRALIYRKDVLEKAGVQPPKTWDELLAASKAIKAKVPGIYPTGYTGLTEHMYLPTIWQAGGQIAKQDGDSWTSALNTPQAAKAIQFYTDFYKEGLTPKAAIGWEEPDAQTAFINGDIAMLIGGGWTYNSIIQTKPGMKSKIGTELEPAGPSGKDTAFAGGSHLVVFNGSKDKDLANAFVDDMLEADEPQQVHQRRRVPARHRRRHQGLRLPRRPRPQAVRRAAARPLRRVPAVPALGRAGGGEHLRR